MNPGTLSTLIGGMLLLPLVYFGLGFLGVGVDTLTAMTNSEVLSKLILGAIGAVSTILLVNGYLTLRDGKEI